MYVGIYIYIERERERDRYTYTYVYMYMCIYVYIYIYIYIYAEDALAVLLHARAELREVLPHYVTSYQIRSDRIICYNTSPYYII